MVGILVMNNLKKNLKTVAAMTLALVITACGAAKLEDKLDLGKKYLEELNYDEAIAAFDEAIEIDPANIDAYVGKAKAYEGKSTTIDDVEESLDTLLLAYVTLDDMVQATDVEYTGIDESMDSVSLLMGTIETEFTDEIYPYLTQLQEAEDFDTVQKLKDKYSEYFDINFDYYLMPASVTVSGVYVYISMTDGQVYYNLDDAISNDTDASFDPGIYLDSPITMPNGEQTQVFSLAGYDYDWEDLGSHITITGMIYPFEFSNGTSRYGIVEE